MKFIRGICALALSAGAWSCGGGGEEAHEEPVVQQQASTGHERPQEEAVQIEGLMGTLTQDQIQRGIEPRMGRFEGCFSRRMGSVELLRGRIELAFRVNTDGSVKWVYPRRSSIGDRETERCVTDIAGSIHFSRPRGGEAEFTYPLEWPGDEELRPPLNWDATRIEEMLSENGPALVQQCGRGAYQVTAYIARGGNLISVGAAAQAETTAPNLDCVCDGVRTWTMPDPGSYPAKISFIVQ
jgi:hypothetical protein